uniref:Methyltransferase-like protein 7A isoform X1 n=1 Tax=Rhizophora mucronata TaxID=61149 RepID=A0A2P2K2H5_RHIMU
MKTTNTIIVTTFNSLHGKEFNALDCSSREPEKTNAAPLRARRYCLCWRRHFLKAAVATALLPVPPSKASDSESDYMATLNSVRPPSPDWYEEWYAFVENSTMQLYETEIAVYKSQLFTNLRGKAKKILEIGIGTGPNLRYYASDTDVEVYGVDPNRKMEKYAREAAVAAGLPQRNFKFICAVCKLLS